MGIKWEGLDTVIWLVEKGVGFWYRIFGRPSRQWEKLAQDLNLGCWYEPQTGYDLAGGVGELYLRVTQHLNVGVTEVRVEARDIPRDFLLRGEGYFEEERDIPIGDVAFDTAVHVQGDEKVVFALLTPENREKLLDFVHKGGLVAHGIIRLSLSDKSNVGKVRLAIGEVLEIGRNLLLPAGDIPKRLAENANGKDILYVRHHNLQLLQQNFGSGEIARKASTEALTDRRSIMRFQSAVFLRDYEMLAKIAAIESEPDDIQVLAIEFLVENAPPSAVFPVLENVLDSVSGEVKTAAIAGLGELRHRPSVDKLCGMAKTADKQIATALAGALGKIGDPAAEKTLVELLGRADGGVRIAAAEALGRVGTTAAVEPLMDMTKSLLDFELKRTAGEAIARIQSRLGDAEAGRLTLSSLSEQAGALSYPAQGGELTLSTKKEGIQPPDSEDDKKSS